MIGAIAGDIIGSVYEWHNIRTIDFPLLDERCTFTDDTVLTVAVADAILNRANYGQKLKEYYRLFPDRGYGAHFRRWAAHEPNRPYYSLGNGSAMRVSPVGFAFNTLDKVLKEARKSAEPTHNHPEGIKGAQAVASSIFLAREGATKDEIKKHNESNFGYDLNPSLDQIRITYRHDETCPGSVPQAIRAFLESNNYEDAVRKAIYIGGDSDTIACIAGGIAEAYYKKIPSEIIEKVEDILDPGLYQIVSEFRKKYSPTHRKKG